MADRDMDLVLALRERDQARVALRELRGELERERRTVAELRGRLVLGHEAERLEQAPPRRPA